jgi:TPR repeat protein
MLLNRPLFVAIALAIAAAAPMAHAQSFGTEAVAPVQTSHGLAIGIREARAALDASRSAGERQAHASRATTELTLPATAGDATAAWYLGSLQMAGFGAPGEATSGVAFIRQAADAGLPAAAFWMAQHPASPASRHPTTRIHYLKQAAFAGHVSAMHMLAVHFSVQSAATASATDHRNAEIQKAFWESKEAEHAGALRPVVGRPDLIAADSAPIEPTAHVPDAPATPASRHVASVPPSAAVEDRPTHPAPMAHRARREDATCQHNRTQLRIPGVAYDDQPTCRDGLSQSLDQPGHKLSPADMNQLGLEHYALGEYGDATAWFHRASRAGLPAGITNFALMLMYGRGVDQDARRAVKLLQKSDALGNATAALNLGQLHSRGAYVEHNEALALAYFRRAEARGSDAARSARIQLMRRTGLQ